MSKSGGKSAGAPAKGPALFADTDGIVTDFFRLEDDVDLGQRGIAIRVKPPTAGFDVLVGALYARIAKNAGTKPGQSDLLWKERRQTQAAAKTEPIDAMIERAVARLGKAEILPDWYNRMLAVSAAGGPSQRAAVDLVRLAGDEADLVTVRSAEGNPLTGAIDALKLGLAYLLARKRAAGTAIAKRPVMLAKTVSIQLLAPAEFYSGFRLVWLRQGLDAGLKAVAAQHDIADVVPSFQMLAFPSGFAKPLPDGIDPNLSHAEFAQTDAAVALAKALQAAKPVYPG